MYDTPISSTQSRLAEISKVWIPFLDIRIYGCVWY